MVGRRGEAPLVPPYILPSFKMALALNRHVAPVDFNVRTREDLRPEPRIEYIDRKASP